MFTRRGLLLSGAALLAAPALAQVADDWALADQIVARIKPPTFPDRDFPLETFGGDPHGVVDSSEAFRKAIAAAHDAGGGFQGVAEPSIIKHVNGLKLENVRVNGKVARDLTGAV